MFYDVTLLRENGMRLRKGELQLPVRGFLSISDDAGGSSFKRRMRVATVYVIESSVRARRNLVPPLFDPQLLTAEDGELTLSGIELRGVDGRIFEQAQLWRCVPVGD